MFKIQERGGHELQRPKLINEAKIPYPKIMYTIKQYILLLQF